MKYLFILLLGFIMLGSATVSLAADGVTTEKSQFADVDIGDFITLECEMIMPTVCESQKSAENTLLDWQTFGELEQIQIIDLSINDNRRFLNIANHNRQNGKELKDTPYKKISKKWVRQNDNKMG